MAAKVTAELGGAGIWGVEFFITAEGAYFSELSPRPHDTGMVTLGKTQNLNEFELHARAVLSLPNTRTQIASKWSECCCIGRMRVHSDSRISRT